MRSMRTRLTALTTALTVGVAGAGLPPTAIAQSPAAPAATATPVGLGLPDASSRASDARLPVDDTPAHVEGAIEVEAIILDALSTADALPATEWELHALAGTLGDDAEAAFRLVRDRIGFEPYPGVLRGAEGTLAARAGNAYDRALLLQGLLDAMGLTTRFAFGELDADTAAGLVRSTLAGASDPLPVAGALGGSTFDLGAVANRARRDHALLRDALDASGGTIDGRTGGDLVAEVRPHAWVQVDRDGTWLDLDPSLRTSAPGDTLTDVASIGDVIPEGAWHSVTIQVHAESLVDGRLERALVLEQRIPAAAGSEVFLFFQPDTGGGGLLFGAAAEEGAFVPVLMVDGEATPGEPFSTLDGEGGGGGFGFFGGGGGGSFAGLWLTVVREAPGRDPLTTERALVNRVPDAARTSGDVPTEALLPLPAIEIGPTAMAAIHHIVVSTGGSSPRQDAIDRAAAAWFVAVELVDPLRAEQYSLGDLLWPTAVADATLTSASERVVVPSLAVPGLVAPVIDRPRITVASVAPDPADPGRILTTIDLAADEVRLVADEDADPADLAARQLWYGALQSALETESLLQGAAFGEPDGRVLTGASLAMGQPLTVLTDSSSLPGAAAQALRDSLDAGLTVVVPGDPASAQAWWTVNPAGGATRAVLAPGLGGVRRTEPMPDVDIHDVQGGWTPGGGGYVNASSGVKTFQINPDLSSFEVKPNQYRIRRPPPTPREQCRTRGGEYITLVGCVSLPVAMIIMGASTVAMMWALSRIQRAIR